MTTVCRERCGACCIEPSISSPLPGMPDGKPAGVHCPQLTDDLRCRLFAKPERPEVCGRFKPSGEHCGRTAGEATRLLRRLEEATEP